MKTFVLAGHEASRVTQGCMRIADMTDEALDRLRSGRADGPGAGHGAVNGTGGHRYRCRRADPAGDAAADAGQETDTRRGIFKRQFH